MVTISDRMANCIQTYFAPFKRLFKINQVFCQFAGGGSSKNGLTEAFENGGYAVEVFAAGVHSCEDRIEFVGNAFLLVDWSYYNIQFSKKSTTNCGESASCSLCCKPRLYVLEEV